MSKLMDKIQKEIESKIQRLGLQNLNLPVTIKFKLDSQDTQRIHTLIFNNNYTYLFKDGQLEVTYFKV